MATQGPPSVAGFADDTLITLIIGPEDDRCTFSVHREILCKPSSYFRTALNGPWKEAQERAFTLEDVTPAAFKLIVTWLYKGHFSGPPKLRPKPLARADELPPITEAQTTVPSGQRGRIPLHDVEDDFYNSLETLDRQAYMLYANNLRMVPFYTRRDEAERVMRIWENPRNANQEVWRERARELAAAIALYGPNPIILPPPWYATDTTESETRGMSDDGAEYVDVVDTSSAPQPVREWMDTALDAYIFADKHDFPKLKSAVLVAWEGCTRELARRRISPYVGFANRAFENLPDPDPFLVYISWWLARYGKALGKEELEGLPEEIRVAGVWQNMEWEE